MKLSVITINRNNAAGLEKTMQSVVCQKYTDFEYIVIDGASDDGSVEVIKKFSNNVNYWISESDSGIYNAMNKGIRKAQGEYCLFLNSADCLISSDTLSNVFNEIKDMPSADIFYSDWIRSDGYIVYIPQPLTIEYVLFNGIHHQNSLIKRSLFLEHGLYNENFRIISDWEFYVLEFWKHKSTFSYIKTKMSIYDINGVSSKKNKEHTSEIIDMYKNIFPELSEIIIESHFYHYSVYYYIIEKNYGNFHLLVFLLRCYIFIFSRARRIKQFFTSTFTKTCKKHF
jgi:glycosyltransferase involved in cell wall biosynthesis